MPDHIVTPDIVEQQVIDLLARRHTQYVAKFERQIGLRLGTIGRLAPDPRRPDDATGIIGLLVDDDQQQEIDSLPACLLACADAPEQAIRSNDQEDPETEWLGFTWEMELHVWDLGGGRDPRADAMRRVRWQAMTVIECLMRELPGQGEIGTVEVRDGPRFESTGDSGYGMGHGGMAFAIHVPHSIPLAGGPLLFEPDPDEEDDPSLPPDPYQPPTVVALTDAEVEIDRRPITPPDYLTS